MELLNHLGTLLAGFGYVVINFFGFGTIPQGTSFIPVAPLQATSSSGAATTVSVTSHQTNQQSVTGQKIYSHTELLALADDSLGEGTVPLGDYRYVTSAPKKGYVYLCAAHRDSPGSMVNGPWIHGTTWNFKNKVSIDGSVSWSQAVFAITKTDSTRTLAGNDLPLTHTTGVFPVAVTDDAHQYDANPNTISAQTLRKNLPATPTYSNTPYCMGGEVGIMLSGVALFNAFDAGLRDAPAHELQDSCEGHPQGSGEYHYHSLSSCFTSTDITTVIGFAYDGFPITGPVVAPGKYLTTTDLDECHGITSDVVLDGKTVSTYHYVMTYDFPYSASCFRGKPITTGPSVSGGAPSASSAPSSPQAPNGTPPAEALTACANHYSGTSCSFTGARGETVSGTCMTPPGSALACVPR